MDVRDYARDYLKRGFAPIPIPSRAKAPTLPDWQHLSVTEDEVDELFTENIGLLLGVPSEGLVDADLDSPEAIALAKTFLPMTGMIHGRASKPRSHWWYLTDPAPPTKRYLDTDGSCLVELRGTGGQTVVPPSVHPEGEAIEWVVFKAPALCPLDKVSTAVRRLAAAALLARHYPAQGGRQDLAMALSGALLNAGWTQEDVRRFIGAVAQAAADEEADKRVDTVGRTADNVAQGKPVTGLPTLSETLGEAVTRRLAEWLEIGRSSKPRGGGSSVKPRDRGDVKQLQQLLELMAGVELFHSPQDEAFVTVATPRGPESFPVDGLALDTWVSRAAFDMLGFYPREQLLKELKHRLAGEALLHRPCYPVHVRVAGNAERMLVDLADEARNVVEITDDGWRLIQGCPERFFRPSGMEALPVPKPHIGIGYFTELFNCESVDDLRLVLAWLAFALNPAGPYPILILQGEPGSGKSTVAEMIRRIVDPASVAVRSVPRDERELVIGARTSHVQCFDNLSGLSERESDSLCRIATGAGVAVRRLYSDWDEVRFKMRRPVILCSIDDSLPDRTSSIAQSW